MTSWCSPACSRVDVDKGEIKEQDSRTGVSTISGKGAPASTATGKEARAPGGRHSSHFSVKDITPTASFNY